ncbi:TRAP transporter substrate-binding protein DctP [Chloroflexota bacterium]
MKRFLLVPLAILLIGALISGSCAKPATPEVINLKLAHVAPPMSFEGRVFTEFKNKIEEQTQGRVTVTLYFSQSLFQQEDTWTSVIAGIGDITFFVVHFEPERFPLNMVLAQLPLRAATDIRGSQFWDELWNKIPEMRAEFDEVKVLSKWLIAPADLHFTKKEVRVPGDMRGLEIIGLGRQKTTFLQAAGASPLALVGPDWYMSLERGLGDGLMMHYHVMDQFGCTELLPYHTNVNMGHSALMALMNLDTWNSLPPDIQKIIDDLGSWMTEAMIASSTGSQERAVSKCQELGHAIYDPTPQERQLWLAPAMLVTEKWIEETEAKGLPTRAVFEEAMQLSEKYRQIN